MKKVKKYYPGTESLYANTGGWSYGLGNNSGMTNPGNQTLNQTTTTSSSTIPTGSLPASGDISQLTKPLKQKASGGGFSDLMGGMKGMDIGGMASSLGGSIAMMINANKKQDPTGRPYKTGTNMIKYQKGTESAKNIKYILKQNKNNAAMTSILMANAANAKKNSELNNRVAPKKLEGKKASLSLDTLKTNKPSFIKYQSGTNATDIIGPGPLDNLPEMSSEQLKKFNDYNGKKEIAEAIDRVNRMGAPVSPLTSRMASFKAPEQTPMTPNLNRVPVKEQSRRERKAENRKLEGMAKAPITYNENSFVGPSDQELQLGRTRENAQSARNTYETRLAAEEAEDQYDSDMRLKEKARLRNEAKIKSAIASGVPASINAPTFSKESIQRNMEKQAGGPVSTQANPILYKEPKMRMAGKVSFKEMTPAQQKQYRAGIASGKQFSVEGIGGKYGATNKSQQSKSSKMAGKGNGPVRTEADWQKLLKERKPTLGKNFNNPNFKGNTQKSNQKSTNIPSPIMDYKEVNRINNSRDDQNNAYRDSKAPAPFGINEPFNDIIYDLSEYRIKKSKK